MQVGTVIKVIYFLIAIILATFIATWLGKGQNRLETGEYDDFMRVWNENVIPLMNMKNESSYTETNINIDNKVEIENNSME